MKVEAELSEGKTQSLLPRISYSASSGKSLIFGNSFNVSPSLLASSNSCSISPTLPTGLAFDPLTCAITGTSTIEFSQTYTVTATNDYGSTQTSVLLESEIYAPTISYPVSSASYGANLSVAPTVLEENGAPVTNCTSAPALPAGLTINSTTCVISGSTSVIVTSQSYLITATNSAGASSTSFVLTITPIVPSISYAGSTGLTGSVGSSMSVTPSTLNINGAAISSCTVSPALPSGLSIHNTTCVISGTPQVTLASTSFTVSATNSAGTSTSTVSLVINPAAPTISYSASTGTSGTVASVMSVTPSTLSTNGAAISSCTISPALPAGLSIHNTTCVISGTPTIDSASANYTVTATNSVGSTTATVTLETNIPCPNNFVRIPRNTSVGVSNSFCLAKYEMRCVGSSCPSSTPGANAVATSQGTGTPWVSISIQNAQLACQALGGNYDLVSNAEWMAAARRVESLPTNWSTGTVGSGTLSIGWTNSNFVQASTDASCLYNSSADACGATGSFLNKRTHFVSSNEELWDFAGNADEWIDWSMSSSGAQAIPALCNESWAWKEIPTLTCAGLTAAEYMPGNPTGITAGNYNSTYGLGQIYFPGTAGLFSVRGGKYNHGGFAGIYNLASRSDGLAHVQVGFRCVQRAYLPAISFSTSTGTSGTAGQPMSVTPTLSSLAGSITNCTVSPALPTGLSINTSTCVISGTPTQAIGNTTFTVTATNSSGTNSATVTLSVAADRPTISYSGASGTSGSRNIAMSVSPTTLLANGSAITNCTISPTLPTGLSINTSTCAISGTPTVVSASTTYTVTVTNSMGTSTATVSLWTCPINFIPVDIGSQNSGFGVSAFCVAKYEMKCSGTSCNDTFTVDPGANAVAVSQPSGKPWFRTINTSSRTACSNLNALNGVTNKYRLPTNAHWMTIARSIERNGNNWSSGIAGNGTINTGHSDNSPSTTIGITDTNDPYDGTGDNSTSAWDQKRTHQLHNGQIIWDFAGNAIEWLDWDVTMAQKAYVLSDGSTVPAGKEFSELDANVAVGDVMYIENIKPFYDQLGSAAGLGIYVGGAVNASTATIRRGGHYGWRGLYVLDASYDTADPPISFRCVYEP